MKNLLSTVLVFALAGAGVAMAERRPLNPEQGRAAVSRAMEDVRHASGFAPSNGKERERFHNAQHSLSELDRSYSKDRFNKDRLDDAIRDIQNIVDHNTIAAGDRDAMNQDLDDLRTLRAIRD